MIPGRSRPGRGPRAREQGICSRNSCRGVAQGTKKRSTAANDPCRCVPKRPKGGVCSTKSSHYSQNHPRWRSSSPWRSLPCWDCSLARGTARGNQGNDSRKGVLPPKRVGEQLALFAKARGTTRDHRGNDSRNSESRPTGAGERLALFAHWGNSSRNLGE